MANEQENKNLDSLLEDIALEPNVTEDNDKIDVDNQELKLDDIEYETNELDLKEDTFELSEDTNEHTLIDEEQDDTLEDFEEVDTKIYDVQKKQTKLQKILIGIVVILALLIIIGLILYLLGFFDPEKEPEPKKEVKNVTKVIKKEQPSYKFKEKDINVDRLNQKLNMLTKYEVLENEQKELQKQKEKELLERQKQLLSETQRLEKINKIKEIEAKKHEEVLKAQELEQDLIQKAKNPNHAVTTTQIKEEVKENNPSKAVKPQIDIIKENQVIIPVKEDLEIENVEIDENIIDENKNLSLNEEEKIDEENLSINKKFIKFIVINTKEKYIFKNLIDEITSIDKRVNLCRDDENKIQIFIGPFKDNQERDFVINKFDSKKNPESFDFTQEEFDKRCEF